MGISLRSLATSSWDDWLGLMVCEWDAGVIEMTVLSGVMLLCLNDIVNYYKWFTFQHLLDWY